MTTLRIPSGVKVCKKCGRELPFSAFTKHKLGRNGLRPHCKDCTAIESAAYRARTVAQRAEYNARYRRQNRDRHLAYNRAWNKAHPDSTRASLRRYRAANAETLRMAKALRRKLHGSRRSALLALERIALYGGLCYYCGAPADTVDHRIPISRGGTNLPANLVPACRSCNSRKRTRTEREFREVMATHG